MKRLVMLGLLLMLQGCTKTPKVEPQPQYAHRQLPPEAVYGRFLLARLDEVPTVTGQQRSPDQPESSPKARMAEEPEQLGIVGIELNKATLSTAASKLSAATGYRVYVSSKVSKRIVSTQITGTIEELATAIAQDSNTVVHLDHEAHVIRFIAQEAD